MKRVLVIGSGGAGKSTFATRLGEILRIPVIHLDALYWQPGWVEPPREDWLRILEEAVRPDAWIMDGNYTGTLDQRLAACDTAIFLDFPPGICLWRVTRRAWRYRHRTREDMAPGCNEKLDLEFLFWVWSYRRRSRPKVEALLQKYQDAITVIRLHSPADVDRYLETERARQPA